jgi:hypothetical protein
MSFPETLSWETAFNEAKEGGKSVNQLCATSSDSRAGSFSQLIFMSFNLLM